MPSVPCDDIRRFTGIICHLAVPRFPLVSAKIGDFPYLWLLCFPLAVSGGELAVTGRTYRPTLQCRDLPMDGRTDGLREGWKAHHPPYSNHAPYYIYKAQYSIYTESSQTTQNTLKTQHIHDMHLAECRSNHVLRKYLAGTVRRMGQQNPNAWQYCQSTLLLHTIIGQQCRLWP